MSYFDTQTYSASLHIDVIKVLAHCDQATFKILAEKKMKPFYLY